MIKKAPHPVSRKECTPHQRSMLLLIKEAGDRGDWIWNSQDEMKLLKKKWIASIPGTEGLNGRLRYKLSEAGEGILARPVAFRSQATF